MPKIKVAIAGVGNCCSSLVQGVHYYTGRDGADAAVGLAHPQLGGYRVEDIQVVCAFDIDQRKVGRPLNDAVLALPNNTTIFHRPPTGGGPTVLMGPALDGVAEHLQQYDAAHRFVTANAPPCDVPAAIRDSGATLLVNYMPVGSQRASEFYAQAAIDAGVGFVNCVPVFIVSDAGWRQKFVQAGLPCVGDDIKAQVGATVTHRALMKLFDQRGVRVDSTYQLNTGGNTDFLNMLSRERLASKKISKTQAVQSQLGTELPPGQIHVGPSDFVPFLKDNKVAFIRIEGTEFGGVPLHLEMRLSVEDSPNSAGVVVDAIRAAQLALDAGLAGAIDPACAWTMKHPPQQQDDPLALAALHEWVRGLRRTGGGS